MTPGPRGAAPPARSTTGHPGPSDQQQRCEGASGIGDGRAPAGAPSRPGDRNSTAGSDTAQATVELALLLPVVAVLLAALLQVAAVARDAVLVTHAAREGARRAAVDADPNAARQAVLAATGLDPGRLEVRVSGRGEPGSQVRVEVVYRLEGWVPVVGRILTDRTLVADATMRVE